MSTNYPTIISAFGSTYRPPLLTTISKAKQSAINTTYNPTFLPTFSTTNTTTYDTTFLST